MSISNLYPPIVPDMLPAFIRTSPCRIYFDISKYNSIDDIAQVQVSLVNQKTNTSALASPSGIKVADLKTASSTDISGYNYYVEINPSDLGNKTAFELNQFYKVQLRFSKIKYQTNNSPDMTWLYENSSYFSEWSKVCLIKGIETPRIFIHGFNDIANDSQEVIFTSPIIDIIGKFQTDNSEESEYLKSYNIKIYQTDNLDNVLLDSGEIYTNPYSPNELNYEITYDLQDGINYTLLLTYTTNNLYSNTIQYNFTIVQYSIVEKLNAEIKATPDKDNGRIKIEIKSLDTLDFIGSFTIRRSSSESDFHTWEDIKTITYETKAPLNYVWYDTTIKSGVWYKYCAQRRNSVGDRSIIIQTSTPVMCLFDDIFLTAGGRQLRIKFNPNLSGFKYNVVESQQVPIGSKFPYIKRNGANYFRTFSLGGLISSFMDTSNWYDPHFNDEDGKFHPEENEIKAFSSKQNIYGNSQGYYDTYNINNNISEYNDYIYEREFREKVYDFLYQHNVKLFRSTTEGNILIKLMNIDFQPIESLGRRLYSFTATAVQVDQANISNYDKYKIQTIGNYDTYVQYTHEVFGQISGTFSSNDNNILEKINTKYKTAANEGYINKVDKLTSLKLEIESDPYVIVEKEGALIKAINEESFNNATSITQGYIVSINGQEIIIPPQMIRHSTKPGDLSSNKTQIVYSSVFELNGDNVEITSLVFKNPTTVTISYVAVLQEIEDTSNLVSEVTYTRNVGQLYGMFDYQDSLVRQIYKKYAIKQDKFYQELANINGVKIEGPPNAVIYIKDSKDNDFNRHVLENGFLQLIDNEVNIEGLYFGGIHLNFQNDSDDNSAIRRLRDDEYVFVDEQSRPISQITSPILNGVYGGGGYALENIESFENNIITVENNNIITDTDNNFILLVKKLSNADTDQNLYIYYQNHWYPFIKTGENSGDVLCPVEGLVDYYYEIIKGVYRNGA